MGTLSARDPNYASNCCAIELIFGKAHSTFQHPAKLLRAIVNFADAEERYLMGPDVKGHFYKGLLEKSAQNTKRGAALCLALKTNPVKRQDLDEVVTLYNPTNRRQRNATWSARQPDGRWGGHSYDARIARDKASMDIFWLKDENLADSYSLPALEVIAHEFVEELEAALEQLRLIAWSLQAGAAE